jgi:predicted nucleic acid-binding protein
MFTCQKVIVVLDASATIKIAYQPPSAEKLSEILINADWVIAPDIYISEVTNVFWKYHQFEDLPLDISENLLNKTIRLIDDVIETGDLYQEAFSFSYQTNHPVHFQYQSIPKPGVLYHQQLYCLTYI